jgi:hypothetical protein
MTKKGVNKDSDVVERLLTNSVDEPETMSNLELEGLGIRASSEFDLLDGLAHRPVQKHFQQTGPEFNND